jgi:thymidylate synthase (FAD)
MKVRLIGNTEPTKEFIQETQGNIENIQELIAFCARVSNPANQLNKETSQKLLEYLMKHRHFSPFELVSATMEIETTRDIARQILRHRSFTFNEFSQRYADPAVFNEQFIIREARLQDTSNRQNSIKTDDNLLQQNWEYYQQKVIDAAKEAYDWAIDNNIAKEQARVVLPEGNTSSRLYMQGTIRSWLHYIDLRSNNGTQQEHIDIALACAKAISEVFPLIDEYVTK